MYIQIRSEPIHFKNWHDAMEVFWKNGWTDGLPVVPPTEEKICEFLEYVNLKPDDEIAEYKPRKANITAEKLAINVIMAGCLPEYMPVVIAALGAITDTAFHLNHLTSTSSPFPLLIVNGPIVKDLEFNTGTYLFGPGFRPNATIGRAISLILSNLMEQKPDGLQRGVLGHPSRFGGCIAENENTPWTPLHVQRGFDKDTSTVTAFPAFYGPRQMILRYRNPEHMCEAIADLIGTDEFDMGDHVLIVPPQHQKSFLSEGWSKEDVEKCIKKYCYRTIAELKRRSKWGWWQSKGTRAYTGERPPIDPSDITERIYLFKKEQDDKYMEFVFPEAAITRTCNILIVTAGGDVGSQLGIVSPYQYAAETVTKAIKV